MVSQLQAIERAQKETMAAVQQTTEAIRNPEARVFNLPSTFSAPGYFPGSTPSITQTFTIQIDASNKFTTAELEQVAVNAVGKMVHTGRTNTSRYATR